MLGIDVDPILIERAKLNHENQDLNFENRDIINDSSNEFLRCFLSENGASKFSLITAFSVSMWIHLNHGNSGLRKFIEVLCGLTDSVIIEPQPLKCYKTAQRRMRKLKLEEYSLLKNEEEFKFKSDKELEEFLSELFEENGLKFVKYLGETHWSRKLMLFQKL